MNGQKSWDLAFDFYLTEIYWSSAKFGLESSTISCAFENNIISTLALNLIMSDWYQIRNLWFICYGDFLSFFRLDVAIVYINLKWIIFKFVVLDFINVKFCGYLWWVFYFYFFNPNNIMMKFTFFCSLIMHQKQLIAYLTIYMDIFQLRLILSFSVPLLLLS